MQPGDLTSLAAAKAWMAVPVALTDADSLISALITAASVSVVNHLGRAPLAVTTFTDIYDVTQPDQLILKQWPVLSITSVSFGTQVVTANAAASWPLVTGYLLEDTAGLRPQKVSLVNLLMDRGRASAQVIYKAGYQVSGEAATVPAGGPYTVTTARTWIGDVGVVFSATGVALVAVTGVPTTGQYSVAAGVYTFAAADTGKAVLLTYSSPPAPVEQAVWEIVGEAFKRKDRAGQSSKTQQGQGTISFSSLPINNAAAALLAPYTRVVPV